MSESERLDSLRATLSASTAVRIKASVVRSWRHHAADVKRKLRQFTELKDLKTCRGVFSAWLDVTRLNLLVLDQFHRAADWRRKGRTFSTLRRFALKARADRAAARHELERLNVLRKEVRVCEERSGELRRRAFLISSYAPRGSSPARSEATKLHEQFLVCEELRSDNARQRRSIA